MVEFGQVYVDTSVIVAATLDQPGALRGGLTVYPDSSRHTEGH